MQTKVSCIGKGVFGRAWGRKYLRQTTEAMRKAVIKQVKKEHKKQVGTEGGAHKKRATNF